MPLFEEYNCLFIHIPKTAGTSIEKALGLNQDYNIPDSKKIYGNLGHYELDHALAEDIYKMLGPDDYHKFYKFAFVRNPYDRLVSRYYHTCKYNDIRFLGYCDSFEEFINKLYNKFQTINNEQHITVTQYLPQSKYIYKNGELMVDFVGRFENLNDDWAKICSKLGINKQLERHMSSSHPDYKNYYQNKSLQNKVYEMYKEDFDNFNYNYEL